MTIQLKPNPGGNIDAGEVIGRDALCERFWRVVRGRSVRLTSERRTGKTSLIRKLKATTPPGTRAIVRDVSGISTPKEFVEAIIGDLEKEFADQRSAPDRFKRFVKAMGGVELGMTVGVSIRIPAAAAPHWKEILEKYFDEVVASCGELVVFFWDEIPWMIQKIAKADAAGPLAAVDVLDALRSVRQKHNNVRMVYTGSIGLHHAIGMLENHGFVHAPVNDMDLIVLGPLDAHFGELLATKLLEGAGFVGPGSATAATVKVIHELAGGVPFYIHHIVSHLADVERATPELAIAFVQDALTSAEDTWEMRHFDARLGPYYADQAGTARAVLDLLAPHEFPRPFSELLSELNSMRDPSHGRIEKDDLLDLLRRMQQDHYLAVSRDDPRGYHIPFNLLRRWWCYYRALP